LRRPEREPMTVFQPLTALRLMAPGMEGDHETAKAIVRRLASGATGHRKTVENGDPSSVPR